MVYAPACPPTLPPARLRSLNPIDGNRSDVAGVGWGVHARSAGNSSVSNTFTITANMTVDPSSISCSPADLTIELIGDGPGSFRPHQFMCVGREVLW